MNLSPARRVATFDDICYPGDYYGPSIEVDANDQPTGSRNVWFLLPIADPDRPRFRDHSSPNAWRATQGNGLHRVSEPPWTFRECEDGSLEIRASIGCGGQPYYWHGYLDEGNVWRQLDA